MYIHIPFCGALCAYCHFTRMASLDSALHRRLVAGIIQEFALRQQRCAVLREGRRALQTVYVGGGTPSVLEPALMLELLAGTRDQLPAATIQEVTAEANPESFGPDVARAWQAAGINRVSLGLQSLDDRVLRALGRRCDADTARRALRLACGRFSRVSADWILGPALRRDRLLAGLREAVTEGVGHISLYILELHAGTPLATSVAGGQVRLPRDRTVAAAYLAAVELLEAAGLRQYEVANFARPGHQSRHNQQYWRRVPYLGLGPGAHGFWGRRRYANQPEAAAYLAAVGEGRLPEAWCDPLDLAARRLERLILPLRTRQGVPLDRIPAGALPLAAGLAAGWWRLRQGRLHLTPAGFLRIDALEERLAVALGQGAGPG